MDKLVRVASIVFVVALLAPRAVAEEAASEKLFQSKCGGCHTIGKGRLVGPDLASTKDWKVDDLTAVVRRMEKMSGPLSDTERADIVRFLKTQTPSTADTTPTVKDKTESAASVNTPAAGLQSKEVPQGDAMRGEMLFTGKKMFANGGMSCIACHTTNGGGKGALGPDLKEISTKMNETALAASCQTTPFKVMKAVYAKHPINKDEAQDLASYLVSVKSKQPQKEFPLTAYGGAGAVLVMISVAMAYRRRNSNVRDKLHRR